MAGFSKKSSVEANVFYFIHVNGQAKNNSDSMLLVTSNEYIEKKFTIDVAICQ